MTSTLKWIFFVFHVTQETSPKDLDQESQRGGREVEELEKRLAYAAAESGQNCHFPLLQFL